MPRKRLSMRKIKEVLRLLWDQRRSIREVAVSCGLARSTVKEYERRALEAGLSWPLPDVDDGVLEERLFAPAAAPALETVPRPDWDAVDRALRRKKFVTRFVLWEEYRAANPEGYSYTRYCELFRDWRGRQDLSMRLTHVAGERLFVDYAGPTVSVVDAASGEIREAQIFVAVLGASSYTFAEATWTQTLPDWIGSHVRALAWFGGCPEVVTSDNLKAGVSKPHLYEPDINPAYLEFARHYALSVIPARSAKPQDNAKAESGVQVVERSILARLRDRTFFSLAELNDAIAALLDDLNAKPFQKRPGSRRSLFEELDRPALRPLPRERYVYADWKRVRAHIDYHVTIDAHHYSVPHQLAKEELDARITSGTIEVFSKGRRVASHARSDRKGAHTTVREHMPSADQAHAGMTHEQLLAWAHRVGPSASTFVEAVIAAREHPQQAYRSCMGVLRLGRTHGNHRLEAACGRAVTLGAFSFKSIEAILKNGLDRQPLDTPSANSTLKRHHENVRGGAYYTTTTAPSTMATPPRRDDESRN
jgi:transposase